MRKAKVEIFCLLFYFLLPTLAFPQTHTMPGNNVIPSGGALNVQSGATLDVNAGGTADFTGATVTGLTVSGTVPTTRTLTINSTTFDLSANRTWTVGDALIANPLSQFAPTTSAQLRGVVNDENGTGSLLFSGATGAALTAPTGIVKGDVGLGNVTNDVQTKAAIVPNTVPTAGQYLLGNGTAYELVSQNNQLRFYVTGITVLTAGAPADIATITLPSWITRWCSPNAGGQLIIYASAAAGTLAAASFNYRDASGGGGNSGSGATLGPTAVNTIVTSTAQNNSFTSTSSTIYIRQTVNSANAGTCSFYVLLTQIF